MIKNNPNDSIVRVFSYLDEKQNAIIALIWGQHVDIAVLVSVWSPVLAAMQYTIS